MLSNCDAGEDSWESLELQGDQTSQILKEINPEYSLERQMLKLQYFGHQIRRADSLEKTLMLGKIEGKEEGDREWDGWMVSLTQWIWVWANSRRWWMTGKPGVLQSMRMQRVGHDWVTELIEAQFPCLKLGWTFRYDCVPEHLAGTDWGWSFPYLASSFPYLVSPLTFPCLLEALP